MIASQIAGFSLLTAALALGAGCNSAPVANADALTTAHARPVEADVIANDVDPDGDTIRVRSVSRQPLNGRATIKNDRTVVYVPNAAFSGNDEFEVQIADHEAGEDGEEARGRVSVTVAPPPPSPSTVPAGIAQAGAMEGPRTPPQAEWQSDTVPLEPGSETLVVQGPFVMKLLTVSGEGSPTFKLGKSDAPIEPSAAEIVALPLGNLEFYVPPGKSLFAQGSGSVAYSGFKPAR